jgi:acyl-CoA thioester hydrolase
VDQSRASVRIRVRWADEDGYGHVNNAVYLNYLEEARDRVVERLFPMAGNDFVIAHIGIDYRAEITHLDCEVDVECRITGYGRSSVRTAEVIRKLDGTVAAEAETVLVPRDAETGGSRPLRADEVAVLDSLASPVPPV